MTQADPLEVLRRRTSVKWRSHPDDVLPMFVAEMDFPLAPAIKAALIEAVERGDTGYIDAQDTRAADAFCDFASDAWGWRPSPDRMTTTTDVSVVIVEALRRLIAPGDGVIVCPPVYAPFFDLIPEAGGAVVEVPLLDDGTRYELDLAGMERALAGGARAVLLCNPHNPVGLVHSREVLERLAEIVERHGASVVSDEIHAPLVFSGRTFTPYLAVSEAARSHGIAAQSGSKAFNLAGLKTAFFVAGSDRMADLIRELPEEVTFRTGQFGLIATREGFASSRDWLRSTVSTIEEGLDLLRRELARELPAVRLREPDATYLAWLDLSALGWGDDPAQHALAHGKVALSNGPVFGAGGAGHVRMNIACAPDTIVEAVRRLAAAAT